MYNEEEDHPDYCISCRTIPSWNRGYPAFLDSEVNAFAGNELRQPG